MNLSVVIHSSGKRPRHLAQLTESLNPCPTGISVIEDSSGTSWGGCETALKVGLSRQSKYILILQEDVIVCRDFVETVDMLVTEHPGKLISFFSPKKGINPLSAQKYFCWAQAYVLPAWMAKELLSHPRKSSVDDKVIADYLYDTDKQYLLTTPSLVEHIGWQASTTRQEKSRLQNMSREARMAGEFIGLETSGLSIDWTA